jgi:hypothetical protein
MARLCVRSESVASENQPSSYTEDRQAKNRQVHEAFDGPGAVKGMKFGLIAFIFYASFAAGWSGVFNLPENIWAWWVFEGIFYYLIGGAALGWTVSKLAPE